MNRATKLRVMAETLLTTSGGLTALAPTKTKPSGNGVIDLVGAGVLGPYFAKIIPYGTGDNNDEFALRFWAWDFCGRGSNDPTLQDLWVPTPVLEISPCVMGASVGVVNAVVAATGFFCDAITIVKEPTKSADVTRQGVSELYSPGSDLIAWIESKFPASQLLQVTANQGVGTPTGMGCLIGLRDV